MVHDVWVEVDLAALKHNFAQVRSAVPEATRVMAVVKGNGFGHGGIEPARAFIEAGADALAVTRLEEALPIREARIESPILLFAPIQAANAEIAVEAALDLTVCEVELAQAISSAAERVGKIARVWIKVDTGMGRLGVLPDAAPALLASVQELPSVSIAGIYTHFATAMEADLSRTRAQAGVFGKLLDSLRANGTDFGIASAANSAAILRLPESHLDMVRPGTLLYGQYPSPAVPHSLDLRPTWKLKARVCQVRDLPKGSRVGYGGEFTTTRPTRTAVIPVGYADGFTLVPEGQIYRQSALKFAAKKARRSLVVEIRGQRAPVLGRVAMQTTVLDVTDIGGVEVGDEAIVPAMRIPTSALIPRVYVDSGEATP
jgi:alanine racemase